MDGGAVKGRGAPSAASLPLRALTAISDGSTPGPGAGIDCSCDTNNLPKEGRPVLVKTLLNSVEKHKGFLYESIGS